MLIICGSSFWHCIDIALGKMFGLQSHSDVCNSNQKNKRVVSEARSQVGPQMPFRADGAYLDSNKERITSVCHRIVF